MLNLISKQSSLFNRQEFTGLNLEKLKRSLSYFSYLHKNEEISDKAFETLVRYACNIFLENEVEILVQEALERKLIQFFRSKFSNPPIC